MHHKKNKKKNFLVINKIYFGVKSAFTLVELVVVATILAILSAVGFSAYTGYIAGARDTNRITQLASINDGLNIYTAKGALPIPDDSVDIEINGETIAYQGYAGANTLETIGYQKGGKDPKDDQYFSYYLDKNKSSFQLMAFLEESENLTASLIGETHANTYTDRFPSLYGQELGILTDANNTPIQEIDIIASAGNLDVSSTSDTYKAHVSETNIITGSSAELIQIHPDTSCERIKQVTGGAESDYYTINPLGAGSKYRIYCNMADEIPNILEQNWELGTGDSGDYDAYGGNVSEHNRILSSNHLGELDIVWESGSTDTDDNDGGWINNSITIDTSKTYRVSVWMKKIGNITTGSSYLGTNGPITRINYGSSNGDSTTNPYFWIGDFAELDKWYLVVGYIHPIGYTGTEILGGIYSVDSIERLEVTDHDYIQESGNTVGRHRAYLRVINDSSIKQDFYDPRYEEIPAGLAGDVKDLLPVKLN